MNTLVNPSYFDSKNRREFEENAKVLGHTVSIKGVTQDDTAHCSCGWKGSPYWDGSNLAFNEWCNHVQSVRVHEQLEFIF